MLEKADKLRKALQSPTGAFAQAFVTKPGSTNALKKGVMIGVLSCQCDAVKKYAGLAGPEYTDGQFAKSAAAFQTEAGKLGLTPVVTAPAPPPLSGFLPGSTGFGRTTQDQWNAALARVETSNKLHTDELKKLTGDDKDVVRGNKELTCAAPKMIQKCLADGHKPGTMIEIWVTMKNASAVVIPRVWGVVDARGTLGWINKQSFGDGAAVPSCTTCQVTCTEMVCKLGQPPCP